MSAHTDEPDLPEHERYALAAIIQYQIIKSAQLGVRWSQMGIGKAAKLDQLLAQEGEKSTGITPGKLVNNIVGKGAAKGGRRLKEYYQQLVQEQRDVFKETPPAHIKSALEVLYPSSQSTTAEPKQNVIEAALKHLLNLSDTHYSVATALYGEYFGYRRSATHGEIIRMYMKVYRERNPDLLRFENLLRRDDNRWRINGFGLVVDHTTHLIGHAVSETDPRTTHGLRSYALINSGNHNWFHGPLTSVDHHHDPIAARVVLIPASQHKSFQAAKPEDRQNKITEMIETKVTPESLDEEIDIIEKSGRSVFADIRCSTQIEYLIWNATFTTLSAQQRPIDKGWLEKCYSLLELQKRAIEFTDPAKDKWPFVEIAKHLNDIFPSNNPKTE